MPMPPRRFPAPPGAAFAPLPMMPSAMTAEEAEWQRRMGPGPLPMAPGAIPGGPPPLAGAVAPMLPGGPPPMPGTPNPNLALPANAAAIQKQLGFMNPKAQMPQTTGMGGMIPAALLGAGLGAATGTGLGAAVGGGAGLLAGYLKNRQRKAQGGLIEAQPTADKKPGKKEAPKQKKQVPTKQAPTRFASGGPVKQTLTRGGGLARRGMSFKGTF